jgi:hypothetical protein
MSSSSSSSSASASGETATLTEVITYNDNEYTVKVEIKGVQVPFNTDQELKRLENYYFRIEPLFFPKQTDKITGWKTGKPTLDLTTLQFVEDNEAVFFCKYICQDNTTDSVVFSNCDCKNNICRSCIESWIENCANASNHNYRKCLTCANKNALPLVKNKLNRRPSIKEIYPITLSQIENYEKELVLLSQFKDFYTYYTTTIGDKLFSELTTHYQRWIYNAFQLFLQDILSEDEDDEYNALSTILIRDSDGNTLIEETEQLSRSCEVIYRTDRCYLGYAISFYTLDDIVDLLIDRWGDYTGDFQYDFIFHHCLQARIKDAFGSVDNEIFRKAIEDDECDIIRSFCLEEDRLRVVFAEDFIPHYTNECIARVLGFTGFRVIRYLLDNNKTEECYILYDEEVELCRQN